MKREAMRGYLFGVQAAATYIGVDRSTFRQWRDDPTLAHRELLQPRIVRGNSYYSIAKLDTFMDPTRNAPGAVPELHVSSST